MSIDPVWAPVIAALGSSFLTVLGTFGVTERQRTKREQASARLDRSTAYGDLLARSTTLSLRAGALGNAMRLRSGLTESLDVLLRLRRPLDPLELHDWIDKDVGPITEAWSRVWAVGTQEAIEMANRLVLACMDVLSSATSPDSRRNWLLTATRGEVWTKHLRAAYDGAMERLARERIAFAD